MTSDGFTRPIWPESHGAATEPTLARVVTSMAENVAEAEKAYARAKQAERVAIVGEKRCAALYDRRAKWAELIGWRETQLFWKQAHELYPHLAHKPARLAAEAMHRGDPPAQREARVEALSVRDEKLWEPTEGADAA